MRVYGIFLPTKNPNTYSLFSASETRFVKDGATSKGCDRGHVDDGGSWLGRSRGWAAVVNVTQAVWAVTPISMHAELFC